MEKILRFKELKKEILKIAIPSTNPDNFVDLEEALDKAEKDLEVSLGR